MSSGAMVRPDVPEPLSPEDDNNFLRSLQINMKELVGDAVGNMSISPSSRDIVLATRNGLFIIDLEDPLNVPRFLPQGGTWDVADVQWNPHLARSEYIVSTSSEKLLIWNLFMTGKTSIEHVLRSHYRAITDINWHNTEPDLVVSTGIDSWLWAWDLRATQKPVMGLCAFGAGGTQVKWNRQDGNLLASSHQNEVLLWDRRKGSLPVSRIKAHTAKIYGIDWAHGRSNEILTCSLDKSIKVWDTHSYQQEGVLTPKLTLRTVYPVWRARDLPFGRGLLSLPQRSQTALEMYAYDSPQAPVERFEGHADVVKEFVWRRGGLDYYDFQLITWSKDKTLRFWPIDMEVMQRAGISTPTHTIHHEAYRREVKESFSNPPVGNDLPPKLSAPIGHRGILAEVRAPFPLRPSRTNILRLPSDRELSTQLVDKETIPSPAPSKPIPIAQERGTMTRGHLGGKSAPITTLGWLSSVEFGSKREGSSGPGSGAESGDASRLSSLSRPPSAVDRSSSLTMSGVHRNTEAMGSAEGDHRDVEAGRSLHDELTSVIGKLSTFKVRLENARDLAKKRTCTIGLHGPWGEGTSVFIRATFTFPRDYPHAGYPKGIPRVDLDRNPLVSMKNRAFILRRLRAIRDRERPCLEKCLRFLLFGDNEERSGRHAGVDSESSSDEDAPIAARRHRGTSFSLLGNDKNLAEPRTSQGVFGPNGQLVCFFPAPPRIVRNAMREISVSPSLAARGVDSAAPRLFQSPALLSDAVRHLVYAAQDRDAISTELHQAEDAGNILRIMTNLFTYSQHKPRRVSENSRQVEGIPASYSLLPQRRSTVLIKDCSPLAGFDVSLASEYSLSMEKPAETCRKNAEIAKARGRVDHERILHILEAVFTEAGKPAKDALHPATQSHCLLTLQVAVKLYRDLSENKDIQMLAMLSILLLKTSPIPANQPQKTQDMSTPDYHRALHRRVSLSPVWPRASRSPTPVAPALSSPTSSRGSWSSLFNTNHMRQFMTGPKSRTPIPLPEGPRMGRGCSSPHLTHTRESSVQPTPPVTKSWSETPNASSVASNVTFSSAGHARRPTFSQVVTAPRSMIDQKRLIVQLNNDPPDPLYSLQKNLHTQLLCHISAYAEMLLAWGLPEKRTELMKSIEKEVYSTVLEHSLFETAVEEDRLGCVRICEHGVQQSDDDASTVCATCGGGPRFPQCTVCRLPAKGLSCNCLLCGHVTHIYCWKTKGNAVCATGCGCDCVHATCDVGFVSLTAPPPPEVIRV